MRREFSKATRALAFERTKGKCERCTARLYIGKFRFNHRIPDWMGGEPTLENCEVLCVNCDSEQTYKKDIPAIAKSKRIIDKRLAKKPRSITGWKNFRGEPIRASRER